MTIQISQAQKNAVQTEVEVPEAGDILMANPGNSKEGTEQRQRRPFLVLSPKLINDKTGRVNGVWITSKKHVWPTTVELSGLDRPSYALSDQIDTLDWRSRQLKKRWEATEGELKAVRARTAASLGIEAK